MLSKLAWRNMKRSARDYLVYLFTMTAVAAFMYAFDSLIFQNEMENLAEEGNTVMLAMISLATVFVVIIVAWLIHYMVRFMLEKRSREFGTYLLLGMKKKVIAKLYMRENLLLGSAAFLIGSVFGVLLSQILNTIMHAMVGVEYRLQLSFDGRTILMAFCCYGGCYFVALFRCRRRFRKMDIQELMNSARKNEEIKEKHEERKRMLLPVAVLFLFVFWAVFKKLSSTGEILLFLIGLVLTIYLFYIGLSAWIICYIRKGGRGIYRGANLFLLRQFSSKIRTMQVTMGTLTALFTLALLGASVAMMFSDYQNTVLKSKFPFDVLIYSSDTEDDFAAEKEVIQKNARPEAFYSYHIYTDEENQVNTWMLTHLEAWGAMYKKKDGTPDQKKIDGVLKGGGGAYCMYDTYMGLSDYNQLREMLGYKPVSLNSDEYAVQIKSRLASEKAVQKIGKDLRIMDASGEKELSFGGIYTEGFSQDGHNGGDYLIIVPDQVLNRMKPYYSELAVDLKGQAPAGLAEKLDNLGGEEGEETVPTGQVMKTPEGNNCSGSDTIVVVVAKNIVRDNVIPELRVMLVSIILPLFYIGLVFVSVAMTVLSVQQLSDSEKYQFRYDLLEKMGVKKSEIRRLIRKQLMAYYLCPVFLAVIISGKLILSLSGTFVKATGVQTSAGIYFAKGMGLFLGIYLVYFIVTYISYKRNVGVDH